MDYIDYGIMDGYVDVGIIENLPLGLMIGDEPRYRVQLIGFEDVEGPICTPWQSSVELINPNTDVQIPKMSSVDREKCITMINDMAADKPDYIKHF